MNKIKLLIALMFFSLTINSQTEVMRKQHRDGYITKTLEVVLSDDDDEYNKMIKRVVEEEWNMTEYKLITLEEFENHENKEKIFALGLFNGNFEIPLNSNMNAVLKNELFFGIVHVYSDKGVFKGRANTYPYTLNSFLFEDTYDFETMIRFSVRKFNNDFIDGKPTSVYKERFTKLKDKKILFLESDLVISESEIKEIYGYDFELVDAKRIEDAINSKEDVIIGTITRRDVSTKLQSAEGRWADFTYANTGVRCFYNTAAYPNKPKKRIASDTLLIKTIAKYNKK